MRDYISIPSLLLSLLVLLSASMANAGTNAATSTLTYAPYKDFTLNAYWDNQSNAMEPEDLSQLAKRSGVKHFTLGFIVAPDANTCKPVWGYDSYSVANQWGVADIAALKQQNGDVAIAFGGQAGTDLSMACTDKNSLLNAYQATLAMYKVNRFDFDVEGALINNQAAIHRMMQAIAELQKQNPQLQISFTLPVLPSGLTQDGISLIQQAISDNVTINYVNLMTMDYGDSAAPNPAAMGEYAIESAQATFTQLQNLYPAKSTQLLWSMIGITPMIGINDVWDYAVKPAQPEYFSLNDVSQVVNFAKQKGINLLASWSIDRDHSCKLTSASSTCSGALNTNNQTILMEQNDYQFAQAFGQ